MASETAHGTPEFTLDAHLRLMTGTRTGP